MGMTDVCNSIGSIESGDLLTRQTVHVFSSCLMCYGVMGFVHNVGNSTHLFSCTMWLSPLRTNCIVTKTKKD